jgi:hypothetical protein
MTVDVKVTTYLYFTDISKPIRFVRKMRPYLILGVFLSAAVLFPFSIWSLMVDSTVANAFYEGSFAVILIFLLFLTSVAAYKLNQSLSNSLTDNKKVFLKKVRL